MQLAKIQLARSIWLFDLQELNPRGLGVWPSLDAKFAQRYGFTKTPTPEELSTSILKWSGGTFVIDDERIEIAVEMHTDGIVVDSRNSTDACDLFIYDVLNWLAGELQVQHRPRIKKKMYRSEVIVYTQRGLAGICETLDSIAATLAKQMEAPHELSAVVFGASGNHARFTFERRTNEDFELNLFFSSAGLTTSAHLSMLTAIEKVIEPELHPAQIEGPKTHDDLPGPVVAPAE